MVFSIFLWFSYGFPMVFLWHHIQTRAHHRGLQCQAPASPILAERAAAHDAQLPQRQKSPAVLPAAAARAGRQARCGEVGQGFLLGIMDIEK